MPADKPPTPIKPRKRKVKRVDPYGPKWSDEFYARSADLARQGFGDRGIAGILGVTFVTYYKWVKQKPALRIALANARAGKVTGTDEFFEYVHGRLPPDLKEVWDEIMELDPPPVDGEPPLELTLNAAKRIRSMVERLDMRCQQQLFLYAWVACNWNASEALTKLQLPLRRYQTWVKDAGFIRLRDFVQESRKDFFESALMKLVAEGNVAAIMFVNRTINRDRGYAEHVKVEGKVDHKHNHEHTLKLEDMDVDPAVLEAMLEATRARAALPAPNVIEAEVIR